MVLGLVCGIPCERSGGHDYTYFSILEPWYHNTNLEFMGS